MLDTGFLIKSFWDPVSNIITIPVSKLTFLKTSVQFYSESRFQIRTFPVTSVHEILHSSSQNVMKLQTRVQKILQDGFQTGFKSETSAHMITRLVFHLALCLETGVRIKAQLWLKNES